MSFLLHWSRLDLRRRWVSLTVLTVLVAIAAGTVLTSVAAARRATSALERSAVEYLPATLYVAATVPLDWTAIRALPEVVAAAPYTESDFRVLDPLVRAPAADAEASPEGEVEDEEEPRPFRQIWHSAEAMVDVNRPALLQGRLPALDRSDEVVVTPAYLRAYGKRLGDAIRVRFSTPAQVDQYFDPENVGDVGAPEGPHADLRIVGVIRSYDDFYTFDEDVGSVLGGAGLLGGYRDNILGTRGQSIVPGEIRLRDGEASLAAFTVALYALLGEQRSAVTVDNVVALDRQVQDSIDVEAGLLLAFTAAAGLTGFGSIALAVSRHARQVTRALAALHGAGISRRSSAACAAIGPGIAALMATVIAVAAAIVTSRWTPFGAAAGSEREPGRRIDWLVLTLGGVAAVGLVVVWALTAAGVSSGRRGRERRLSSRPAAAAAVGVSVPLGVSLRWALERRGGDASARASIAAVALGVAGVVAAACVLAGVADVRRDPASVGQVHEVDLYVGLDGEDFVPAKRTIRAVAALPQTRGLNDLRIGFSAVGATSLTVSTLSPAGDWPVVLTAGRLPRRTGEIALGVTSARTLGVGVGSLVQLAGTAPEPVGLTVVGVGFVNVRDYFDGGALVAPGTFDALFDRYATRFLRVALKDGVDAGRGEAAVRAAIEPFSKGDDLLLPVEYEDGTGLDSARAVPLAMGAFLLVLAVGTTAYVLISIVRRRGKELAVLRALGMTRRQARTTTFVQASVIAVAGGAAGVVLGLLLGRAMWRVNADAYPIVYHAPTPMWALLAAVPVALLVANLLAAWPAWRAGRLQVAQALRAE